MSRAMQQFSACRVRQRFDEFDVSRDFGQSQMPLAMGDQLIGGRRSNFWTKDDACFGHLTHVRIGPPADARACNGRMQRKNGFHFLWEEFHSQYADYVLSSATQPYASL